MAKLKRDTILIVDDVEINRLLLKELFRKKYCVIQAENGQQALDMVRENYLRLAVILLDAVMPVMDGFEFLKVYNELEYSDSIPVVLITAENATDILIRGYELGVSDIINKSFNPQIVSKRVENVMQLFSYKEDLETIVTKQMEALNKQTQKLKSANSFVIDTLSTVIEFRSGESGQHIKRIRDVTKLLLESYEAKFKCGLTPEKIEMITSASAVHDIGKIAIPDSILCKPGKLTDDEYEAIKYHTVKGCEILKSLDYAQGEEYFDMCYDICRHHHERYDGSGYPDCLVGDKISIASQVVSLADVYDALISERCYKTPYTHEKAVSMIVTGECGEFNPKLLECFLAIELIINKLQYNEGMNLDKIENKLISKIKFDSSMNEKSVLKATSSVGVEKHALWALEFERQKYRTLSEISGEILIDFDNITRSVVFSDKFKEVFGRDPKVDQVDDFIHNSGFIHDEDKEKITLGVDNMSFSNPEVRQDIRLKMKDGTYAWYQIWLRALWNGNGDKPEDLIGCIGKMANINEVKELINLAKCDPLTNLYNSREFEQKVQQMIEDKSVKSGSMIFADIDNFKSINDNNTHIVGNEVLTILAECLMSCFKSPCVVSRNGGDEFVVFVPNITDSSAISKKLNRLSKDIVASCKKSVGINVTISMGVAKYPEDGATFDSLIYNSDLAMYSSKNKGKNTFSFYGDKKK